MKNILLIITTAFFLSSCISPEKTPTSNPSLPTKSSPSFSDQKLQEEVAMGWIKGALLQNAGKAFCDQSEYLSCYDIPLHACRNQIDAFNETCMKISEEKYGNLSKTNNKPAFFYIECLSMKHLSIQNAEIPRIMECVSSKKINPQNILKSIIEIEVKKLPPKEMRKI